METPGLEGAEVGAEAGRLNSGGVDAVADRGPGGDEGADVGAGAGRLKLSGEFWNFPKMGMAM